MPLLAPGHIGGDACIPTGYTPRSSNGPMYGAVHVLLAFVRRACNACKPYGFVRRVEEQRLACAYACLLSTSSWGFNVRQGGRRVWVPAVELCGGVVLT